MKKSLLALLMAAAVAGCGCAVAPPDTDPISVKVTCYDGKVYIGIEATGPGKFLWTEKSSDDICPLAHEPRNNTEG